METPRYFRRPNGHTLMDFEPEILCFATKKTLFEAISKVEKSSFASRLSHRTTSEACNLSFLEDNKKNKQKRR